MWAASCGHLRCMGLLLAAGARVDDKDDVSTNTVAADTVIYTTLD